jgi:A/G-specific adenine glycosylase
MIDSDLAGVRRLLLDWYDANHRPLPWRTPPGTTPDPYRVWLSETMLQQTRVETVRPYYERWLHRFPTLAELAAAPLDDVLKAWEGLGYYSRARNLHRAVREVGDRYGGRVPDDPAAFRALPGVGRYTSGAVMSIAFGRAEPIVDGNVRRVFARWTATADPPEAELWKLAADLVVGDRPGSLNQAVMELGALVCTPSSPRCGECPVVAHCEASAAGTQNEHPARRRSRTPPHEDRVAAVLEDVGHVLIARRFPEGRLGGMWEFPGTLLRDGEEHGAAAERAIAESLGLKAAAGEPIARVDHAFTHVRVSYHAVRCASLGGVASGRGYDAWAWVRPSELGQFALPRAQRKIAALAFPTTEWFTPEGAEEHSGTQ